MNIGYYDVVGQRFCFVLCRGMCALFMEKRLFGRGGWRVTVVTREAHVVYGMVSFSLGSRSAPHTRQLVESLQYVEG